MPGYFKDLPPESDFNAIAAAVRDITRSIIETMSYAALSNKILTLTQQTASGAALRMFVTTEGKRVNKQNASFRLLYDYIRHELPVLPEKAQQKFAQYADLLKPGDSEAESETEREKFRQLALNFQDWMHVSTPDVRRLATHVRGTYAMLRRSIHQPGVIVKSTIQIGVASKSRDYMYITHSHRDRYGKIRKSVGSVFPLVRNMHALLRVEKGEGMEHIVVREPMQADFDIMDGFITSMNVGREVLLARIFLTRSDKQYKDYWDSLGERFTITDNAVSHIPYLAHKIATILNNPVLTLTPAMPRADQMYSDI